ncbi:unnamed protein product [Phytomonas sp. Hart1]|nr:unnamed protein product [Phytomonas sp. Hart1]|eukprot:CCW71550.1 unnamed protein product [Phytomonas sp. isolate Hart1]
MLPTTVRVLSPPVFSQYVSNIKEASDNIEKDVDVPSLISEVEKRDHQGDGASLGIEHRDDVTGSECRRNDISQGINLQGNITQELFTSATIIYPGFNVAGGIRSTDGQEIASSTMEQNMRIFFSESEEDMTETLEVCDSKVFISHIGSTPSANSSVSRTDSRNGSSLNNIQLHTNRLFPPSPPHQAEKTPAIPIEDSTLQNSDCCTRKDSFQTGELTNNGLFKRNKNKKAFVPLQYSIPPNDLIQSNETAPCFASPSCLGGQEEKSHANIKEVFTATCSNHHSFQSLEKGGNEVLGGIGDAAARFTTIPTPSLGVFNEEEKRSTESSVLTTPTIGTSAADFLSRDRDLSKESDMSDTHIALGTVRLATWKKGEAAGATPIGSTALDDHTDKIILPITEQTGQASIHNNALQDSWKEFKVVRAQQPPIPQHKGMYKQLESSESVNSTFSEDSAEVALDLTLNSFTASPFQGGRADVRSSLSLSMRPLPQPSSLPPMGFGKPPLVNVEGISKPLHVEPMKGISSSGFTVDQDGDAQLCVVSKSTSLYAYDNSRSLLFPSNISVQVMANDRAMPKEEMPLLGFSNMQPNDSSHVDISEAKTKSKDVNYTGDSLCEKDVPTRLKTFSASHLNSSSRNEGHELEASDGFSWRRDTPLEDEISIKIEDSLVWSENLATMVLLDVTPLSLVYQGHLMREALGDGDTNSSSGSTSQTETVLMVLSVYELMDAHCQGLSHSFIQQRALQLARKILKTQRRLQEVRLAGALDPSRLLNIGSDGCDDEQRSSESVFDREFNPPVVCRGIINLHVDSSNRIIAELDVEPCGISLSDIIAFQKALLLRGELITLLRTVLTCLSRLHKSGFTHGALHGGNITFSTDDGHCTLTQPAGLMNTKIYPDDLSILPPTKASFLAQRLKRAATTAPQLGSSTNSFLSGLGDELELCILELEENAPSYSLQPTDDLYAIGTLALFVITGIPVFYGRTYREVVETLAELRAFAARVEIGASASDVNNGGANNRESVRQALRRRIFGSCFTQNFYVTLRCQEADYTEDFLKDLFEFIFDSMAASFGVLDNEVQYHNAEDLLNHSFFEKYPLDEQGGEAGVVGKDEVMQVMQDMLHRVTYPVYTTITQNKLLCDTKPYIARMHRHSVFSSRWTALKKSFADFCGDHFWSPGNEARSSDNGCLVRTTVDSMGALWPILGRRSAGQWTVSVPWTWSLPLLSENGACSIVGTDHYDSFNYQILHSSFISPENDSKAKVNLTHESVGGEFYLSSSWSRLCIPSSQLSNPYVQDPSLHQRISQNYVTDRIFQKEKAKLEDQAGCKVLSHFSIILFESKQNTLLTLNRGQMDYFSNTIDTVVLQDLEGCRIVLLVPFRFVVLVNVKQCEVYLAPCFICYMHQVTNCTPIAVACMYLLLGHVTDVALHCTASALISGDESNGGGKVMHGFNLDATLKNVDCEPYSLVYPGLSEDFSLVGLVQECSAYAHSIGEGIAPIGTTQIPEHIPPRERKSIRGFNFISAGPRTDDIPYSHASAAFGKRFKHCDDNESDVYFFFNELHGKDVHIVNVHGESKPQTLSPRDELDNDVDTDKPRTALINSEEITLGMMPQRTRVSSDPFQLLGYRGMLQRGWRSVHKANSAEPNSLSRAPHCPVFFVLDMVDDVEIRNCSHCTVFLVGSTGSMIIENCHNMRIFFVARECAIEACTNLELFALTTEYIALECCHDVIVSPLFLKCPYFDRILEGIIQETSEESHEYVLEAYNQRNIYALNKVFQVDGQDVCLSACKRVEIRDLAWCEAHSDEPLILLSVSVPVPEALGVDIDSIYGEGGTSTCKTLNGGRSKDKLMSAAKLSSCNFFRECCEAAEEDIDSIFLRLPFNHMLYRCVSPHMTIDEEECETSNLVQAIRIHDLFNPSLLRLPGSLCIRSDYLVQSEDELTGYENSHYNQQLLFKRHYSSLSDKSSPNVGFTPDLILETIAMGEVHLLETIGNLYIRNCTGPLNILVCGAKYVLMEGCVNVTLRAACIAFDAQDSHYCHVALHVNTPPGYLRCSHMLTSTLNIMAPRLEELMGCVGVKANVNIFDRPLIHPATMRHVTDGFAEADRKGRLEVSSSNTELKDYDWNGSQSEIVRRTFWIEKGRRVESLAQAFSYLRRPIAIVPPLPELRIKLEGIKLCSAMSLNTHLMNEEETAQTLEETLRMAFDFIAKSDLVTFHMLEEDAHRHRQEVNIDQKKDILVQEAHTSTNTHIVAPKTPTALPDIKEDKMQEVEQTSPTLVESTLWSNVKAAYLCLTEDVQKHLPGPPLADDALLRSHTLYQENSYTEVAVTTIENPVTLDPLYTLASGAADRILKSDIHEATPTGRATTGVCTTLPVGDGQQDSFYAHIDVLYDHNSSALESRLREIPFQSAVATVQTSKHEALHEEPGKSPVEPGKLEDDNAQRLLGSEGYDSQDVDSNSLRLELENARREYWRWKEGNSNGAILATRVVAAIQKLNEL